MKKLIFGVIVFILAACSSNKSELSRNQQKWEGANISHYRFELSISCFCPFADQMPLSVDVRDGQIVSMAGANGSLVLDTDPNYAYFARYATIDALFAELEADLGGDADDVKVSYDSKYGFPVEISIDRIKEAVDDELYLSVSGFEQLP